MNLIVFTDGASRGNPGPAAYGYIIKDRMGVMLHQAGEVIGETTNNVAEYTGVLKALEYIAKFYSQKKIDSISFFMDSQLIARQLAGIYKIKNPTLKQIYLQIKVLEDKFSQISYTHIPRGENLSSKTLIWR